MMRHLFFAMLLFSAGFFPSQVGAQSDEQDAALSRDQGYTFQQQGDFRKALFYYQRAMALRPDSAAFCNDAALMQEYIGANKEAEQGYLNAISLDRTYLPAYSNLGIFYSKQGQYAMAVKYLKQRVDRGQPNDPWTLQAQEELIKAYKKVPALDAERLRAQGDEFAEKIVAAKQKMKRSAERNNTLDFEAAYQKGLKALDSRDFSEAVEALETAVTINPRSNSAREALRRARFGKERSQLEAQAANIQADDKSRHVADSLDDVSSR
ncbi:MAG: hypothetical protein WCO69_02680 [Candidatus Omnitrophota bacterium]